MVGGKIVIVAGIGCRRRCSGDTIAALVRLASIRSGADPMLLAAPSFKREEPGLHAAADALGLPIVFVPGAALAAVQPDCATHSARAAAETGFASVAEACALAAAGAGAKLVLRRIAVAGATCALAEAT